MRYSLDDHAVVVRYSESATHGAFGTGDGSRGRRTGRRRSAAKTGEQFPLPDYDIDCFAVFGSQHALARIGLKLVAEALGYYPRDKTRCSV